MANRYISAARKTDEAIASSINCILMVLAVGNIGLAIFARSYGLPKYLAPVCNTIAGTLLIVWGNAYKKDEAVGRMIKIQEKAAIARQFAIDDQVLETAQVGQLENSREAIAIDLRKKIMASIQPQAEEQVL
jgi:hypothetical protein